MDALTALLLFDRRTERPRRFSLSKEVARPTRRSEKYQACSKADPALEALNEFDREQNYSCATAPTLRTLCEWQEPLAHKRLYGLAVASRQIASHHEPYDAIQRFNTNRVSLESAWNTPTALPILDIALQILCGITKNASRSESVCSDLIQISSCQAVHAAGSSSLVSGVHFMSKELLHVGHVSRHLA